MANQYDGITLFVYRGAYNRMPTDARLIRNLSPAMGDKKRTLTEAFGEVLRELRVERDLTQEELALEADTERSHISALERAEKGPFLGTILRLARALNMSAGELIKLVEQKIADKKR